MKEIDWRERMDSVRGYASAETLASFGYNYPSSSLDKVRFRCLCGSLGVSNACVAFGRFVKEPYLCRSCSAIKREKNLRPDYAARLGEYPEFSKEKTLETYGYEVPEKAISPVIMLCKCCGKESSLPCCEVFRKKEYICRPCVGRRDFHLRRDKILSGLDAHWSNEENIEKQRKWAIDNQIGEKLAARTNYDPEIREKINATKRSAEGREKSSKQFKKVWGDHRDIMLKACQDSAPARGIKLKESYTEEKRAEESTRQQRQWEDPAYREAQSRAWTEERKEKLREFNRSPEFLQHLSQRIEPTTEEKILKFFFENLGYEVKPQHLFGPYIVDLYVPEKNLVVEFNGMRWHNPNFVSGRAVKNIGRDKAKASYFRSQHPEIDFKFLDETVLYAKGGVGDFFSYLMPTVDFSFSEIELKTPEEVDGQKFLTLFHYKEVSRPALGMRFGAFYKDRLVAIAVFNSPFSPSSATSLGFNQKEMLELSRFCIHPAFHKKNFATWFLSRCLSQVKEDKTHIVGIISYADTTVDHTGTIYKASNFEFVGDSPASYHYRHSDRRIMHKKSLYTLARKARMQEKEFADLFGFVKIPEEKKLKFVFWF